LATGAVAIVAAAGLSDRVSLTPGDFVGDALPRADIITMGHICATGISTETAGQPRGADQPIVAAGKRYGTSPVGMMSP
jgi:hypothetical protein